MSNHLAVHSPRRTARRALSIFLLALVSASCSRQLATAPEIAGAALAGHDHRSASTPSASTSQTLDDVGDQFVVALAPGADASRLAAEYGAVLLDVQQGFAVLEPQPGEIVDLPLLLKTDARVLATEGNQIAMVAEARQRSWAFDDGFGSAQTCTKQTAVTSLNLAAAHEVSRGGGVRDPSHPLFAGRIAGGWDFIDNGRDPTDVASRVDADGDGVADGAYGHGTHVAGIVVLTAPQASLLVVRVLDSEGRGDVKSVAAGIRWAVANGARVINLSLGLLQQSSAIDIALAEAQVRGVVCVASAGNWGAEYPQEYPAMSPRVISVAATDAENRPAVFTSFGETVDVCAPGVAIRSAYPGGRYLLWSGTSMAAPFVSGAAALLVGLHPDWNLSALRGPGRGPVPRAAGPTRRRRARRQRRAGAGPPGGGLRGPILPGGSEGNRSGRPAGGIGHAPAPPQLRRAGPLADPAGAPRPIHLAGERVARHPLPALSFRTRTRTRTSLRPVPRPVPRRVPRRVPRPPIHHRGTT